MLRALLVAWLYLHLAQLPVLVELRDLLLLPLALLVLALQVLVDYPIC
jgi:hypothetical protein